MKKQKKIAMTDGFLAETGKRLKALGNASATGPLLMAPEVVELLNNWPAFIDEAGGLSCTQWCRAHLGNHVGYYLNRVSAVAVLGDVCEYMHHEVAVWVANRYGAADRKKVCRVIWVATGGEKLGPILSLQKAKRVVLTAFPEPKGGRRCRHCKPTAEMLVLSRAETQTARAERDAAVLELEMYKKKANWIVTDGAIELSLE